MFEFEACEVFKIKEFAFVNDFFKDERNEEIGHFGQTLICLFSQNVTTVLKIETRVLDLWYVFVVVLRIKKRGEKNPGKNII